MYITIKNHLFRTEDIKNAVQTHATITIELFSEPDRNVVIRFDSVEDAKFAFQNISSALGSIVVASDSTVKKADNTSNEKSSIETKGEALLNKLDNAIVSAKETINVAKGKVKSFTMDINLAAEVDRLRKALDINKLLEKEYVSQDTFGFDKEFTDEDLVKYEEVEISKLSKEEIEDVIEKIIAQEIHKNPDIIRVIKMIQTSVPNPTEAARSVRIALLSYRDELVDYLLQPEQANSTMAAALESR